MVDKYLVKDFVSEKIGAEYVIPTINVWDRFDQIDFNSLPESFVLKCTHDSGGVYICKEMTKIDYDLLKIAITNCLKTNYCWNCREWPYKNVKPRIIAESYLKNGNDEDLTDYKFYCFNGNPKYCQVIANRSTNEIIDFFNMNWEHKPFTGFGIPNRTFSKNNIEKPFSFEIMKHFSRTLSGEIPFVRVDFYEINQHPYFGEITFYPASGFGTFEPDNWN